MTSETAAIPPTQLARRPLALAALEGSTPIAGARFEPGSSVSVGSNSGNELVIPEKFELTAYTLITRGSLLHLAPPLYVQATVWVDGEPLELKGYYRDLRKQFADLPSVLPLASERFIIRYATGIALIGRFEEVSSSASASDSP